MHEMRLWKPVLWLVILVAMLIGLIAVAGNFPERGSPPFSAQGSAQPVDQRGVRIPPPQPAPTAADAIAAQRTNGFQLLVSYVNSGFEPQKATIRAGETVRFTNNSTGQLWLAADPLQGTVYPRVENGCGSSALDSCRPLSPGQYWEFTFTEKGTWGFVNNIDKTKRGTIIVQ